MKKWSKRLAALITISTMIVGFTGCDKKEETQAPPAIQSAVELSVQSQVTMVEPEDVTETTYDIVEEATAQIQYVTKAIAYDFRGAKLGDWKKISGSMEEYADAPSVRIIKCNGDKTELQVFTSTENHKVGNWTWAGVTYVLMTEASIVEEDFINECLELVKSTYQATMNN